MHIEKLDTRAIKNLSKSILKLDVYSKKKEIKQIITILKPKKLPNLFLPTNFIRGKINIDIKKITITKTMLNSRNCIFSGLANFGNHLFEEKKINDSKEIKT